MKEKQEEKRGNMRIMCILAVALITAAFFFPLRSQSFEADIGGEVIEKREMYLWGEKVIVRPERPEGGETADVQWSPFDETAPMFAITLSAAISVPFLLAGAFYFQRIKIDSQKLKLNSVRKFAIDIQNPFRQHIYVAFGFILIYMALIDYLFFLYRAYGDLLFENGMYLIFGAAFFALLALVSAMPRRKTRRAKPDIKI